MKVLTCVDGSQWSGRALQHACRFLSPNDEMVLLYVAPRGGPGYVESGEMVLEASLRASGLDRTPGTSVRSKICIGDPKEMIPHVAEEEEADVIVMGSVGADGFPHVSDMGDTARETMERTNRPVVVCSPRGLELLLKDQGRLVTQPRAELARLARAMATRAPEAPGVAPPVADAALVTAPERERMSRGWRLVEHLSRS
jgi:nucleotide-binding universal stress UspA family protein